MNNEIEITDDEIEKVENAADNRALFPKLSQTTALLNDGYIAYDATLLPSQASSKDLVISDPLERYLSEIRHYPQLTREEEHELAIAYKEGGDQMAGYRLVMANLRLVVFIAREYQRNIQNILDLVQEGNIGLLAAIRQFDPYKGIRFPSYATYWIRAYMLRFIINNLRLVKIGTTQAQRKLFYNLQKEKDKLIAAGFVPEAKLLAEKLNVKESEVIEMEQRLALPDASLDAPLIKEDNGSQTLLGILPDHNSDVENNVVDRQFVNSIRNEIELLKPKLDAKEKDIVENRLCADEPQSLQEIGEKHGVSRERIRQIETKLKEKLKTHLSKKLNLNHKGDVINLS